MKKYFITFLWLLASCKNASNNSPDDKKMSPPSSADSSTTDETAPGDAVPLESIDNYLSIGNYLQKELNKPDNNSATVSVFVLLRQDNSVSANFDTLKAALLPANPSLSETIDLAKKQGLSTVEIEVEIGALKAALKLIKKAACSIEISLGTVGL